MTSSSDPSVVQLRPKRKSPAKGSGSFAHLNANEMAQLGALATIELKLKRLETLLACSGVFASQLKRLSSDGSLKGDCAVVKIDQMADLIAMSSDLCDGAKELYAEYVAMVRDIIASAGSTR